jgi:hypothetical protein
MTREVYETKTKVYGDLGMDETDGRSVRNEEKHGGERLERRGQSTTERKDKMDEGKIHGSCVRKRLGKNKKLKTGSLGKIEQT